ncbi:MAG: polymer-forming cytoskeletal protein [Lachnospiraceae bacterium]|nr:polymer-forming cytoskeletal protein [Lachnospiraceae bacterium]
MGFFSDLKEDLSQAVNELMPEEEGSEKAPAETPAEGGEPQTQKFGNIDEMLDRVDSIVVPEVTEEEPETAVQTPGAASEENLAAEVAAVLNASGEPEAPLADMDLEKLLESALSASEPTVPITEEKQETKKEIKGESKVADLINARMAADETSTVTEGMTINGDVVSEGSLDLVGSVNGNIDILGKLNVTGYIFGNSKAAEIYADNAKINGEVVSEGAVKIGASSVIIGNISATSAVIAGAVKGDIDVHGPVILDTSAIVMGNIKSKSVQINNGAVIEGMCSQCYADVNPISFFDDYKPEVKKSRK